MDTIFMNFKNSRTSHPHKLLLNFSGKIDLKRSDKYVALLNRSIYNTWKSIKQSYKKNRFKKSTLPWNEESQLPDGSYSVSNIQNCFEYILIKHGKNTGNPSLKIYISKPEDRITSKIKRGYYLKLETMKLLWS